MLVVIASSKREAPLSSFYPLAILLWWTRGKLSSSSCRLHTPWKSSRDWYLKNFNFIRNPAALFLPQSFSWISLDFVPGSFAHPRSHEGISPVGTPAEQSIIRRDDCSRESNRLPRRRSKVAGSSVSTLLRFSATTSADFQVGRVAACLSLLESLRVFIASRVVDRRDRACIKAGSWNINSVPFIRGSMRAMRDSSIRSATHVGRWSFAPPGIVCSLLSAIVSQRIGIGMFIEPFLFSLARHISMTIYQVIVFINYKFLLIIFVQLYKEVLFILFILYLFCISI